MCFHTVPEWAAICSKGKNISFLQTYFFIRERKYRFRVNGSINKRAKLWEVFQSDFFSGKICTIPRPDCKVKFDLRMQPRNRPISLDNDSTIYRDDESWPNLATRTLTPVDQLKFNIQTTITFPTNTISSWGCEMVLRGPWKKNYHMNPWVINWAINISFEYNFTIIGDFCLDITSQCLMIEHHLL